MADDKIELSKELELALAQIDKQYGKGVVISNGSFVDDVETLSTGNVIVDEMLGVGGMPTGRIVEIFGAEGLGKSMMALCMAAEAQRDGHRVLYIDAEHDLDPKWATHLGVDLDSLILCQPDYGEQALDIAQLLIATGDIKLIIIDSVAALAPKSIIDGTIEDNHVAALPRMMSQALSMMRGPIKKNGTCLVLLNQIRDKIGYGQSGTSSSGGRAIKFYSSVRLELRRIGDVKEGNEVVGTKVQATTRKNKVATPHQTEVYQILDGVGFDNWTPILEAAVAEKLLIKSGSWLYFPIVDQDTGEITKGQAVGNGSKQQREFLIEHPDLFQSLITQLKERNA